MPPAQSLSRGEPHDALLAGTRFGHVAIQIACVLALSAGACVGTLPWSAVGCLMLAVLIGQLVLQAWIQFRNGSGEPQTSAKSGDPVAFAHALLGCTLLALSCALVAPVRGVALQLTFAAIVFDALRLSRWQLLLVAATGVAIVVLARVSSPERIRPVDSATVLLCMAALASVLHKMRSIQDRQQAQQAALATALSEWETLSRHDALTGAVCRRHGSELLQQEIVRQRRDRQPFAIGLLDVDHFKLINDTHGHSIGDKVLVDLVQTAEQALGAPNKIVRWGGEEFLLLLPAADLANASRTLQRVRDRVATHDWSQLRPGLQVDVSIGVSEHRPGDPIEASIARADAALYLAKAEGRGRVVQDHG